MCEAMTDREKLVELLDATIYEALGGYLVVKGCKTTEEYADHLIANGVTVRKPSKVAENCRHYTVKGIWGACCLATKEIDPCKGDGCEWWKAKEGEK